MGVVFWIRGYLTDVDSETGFSQSWVVPGFRHGLCLSSSVGCTLLKWGPDRKLTVCTNARLGVVQMICLFVNWSSKASSNSDMLSHCLCPHCRSYWVLCPAVLESGEPTKVCMSLIKPNETVTLTATLTSKEQNITVLSATTTTADIHICKEFQVNRTGVGGEYMYIVAVNNSLHVGQQSQKWSRQFPVKNVAGSKCGKGRCEGP